MNNYNVTTITQAYTASNEEYIISDGSTVTLPEPSANAIVAVASRDGTHVPVEPNATESVEFDSVARVGATAATYFVSDGTNWYLESGRGNVFGAIPDSGLAHRWKASDLSLNDGDTVSTWSDMEGNADLSANGNPTFNASSNLNGKPAITYDGTDDDHITGTSAVDSSPPYHLFYVVDSADSGDQTIMRNEENGMQHRMSNTDQDGNDNVFHGEWVSGGADFTGQQSIFAFAQSDDTEFRRNGTVVGSASNTYDSSRDASQWRLGSRSVDYFGGDIAEVIWYNEIKSANEIDEIESYLSSEYGITI